MSRKMAWWVTPAMDADMLLDGPFDSFDTCQAKCLARVDRVTAARMLSEGKIPYQFQPRLREAPDTLHSYRSLGVPVKQWSGEGASVRGEGAVPLKRNNFPVQPASPSRLPQAVMSYSRSALLVLCEAMGVEVPRAGLQSKRELIEHIERTLESWSKRK